MMVSQSLGILQEAEGADGHMDEWIEQFSQQTSDELQEQQQRRALSSQAGLPTSQEYIMSEDNPFLEACPAPGLSLGPLLQKSGLAVSFYHEPSRDRSWEAYPPPRTISCLRTTHSLRHALPVLALSILLLSLLSVGAFP